MKKLKNEEWKFSIKMNAIDLKIGDIVFIRSYSDNLAKIIDIDYENNRIMITLTRNFWMPASFVVAYKYLPLLFWKNKYEICLN